MTIVRATLADLERAAALFDAYRVFYEQPSDVERARQFLKERLENDESVIYLAESNEGEAVGFMQLFESFSSVSTCRIWILNDLYVPETLRGGGVGTALLQRAADHARKTGARRVVLATAHTNTRAQRVYESFGYVMETRFRQYAYEVA